MSDCVIGLFGTCGGSKWRDAFINHYESHGVDYFNPLKDNWCPEDSVIEAEHLVNDEIVLFPITSETYGTGSLAETGYSIMNAIRANDQRFVIIYIDTTLDKHLFIDNPTAAKESCNTRAIVTAHLRKVNNPNVFIVSSLEEMLDVSMKLHEVVKILKSVRKGIHDVKIKCQV